MQAPGWKSFNPCFSGYGIQTLFWFASIFSPLKFQSLFFWIWNSDQESRAQQTGWNWVSILVFLDMEFRHLGAGLSWMEILFQSLFFWIWNSDCLIRFGYDLYVMFQSLFFWIWNSDIFNLKWRYLKCQSFNPCFSGYGIQTKVHL